MDDDTLRKIGRTLRLGEHAFVGARHIPTPDQVQEKAEELLSQITAVNALPFSTLKDCDAVLHTLGFIVDDRHVNDNIAPEIAALKDLMLDWSDLYPSLSHTEQVKACQGVLAQAQKIEAGGYLIRYAAYKTDDDYPVSAFVLLPNSGERSSQITQLLVPRRFTELASASLRT